MVEGVFEVSDIYKRAKARKIAKLVCDYKPQKIMISGYAIGHEMLVEEIKRLNPEIRTFVFIHSAFIWFDVYPAENYVFKRFIEMAKEGIIEKIGFCKRDLAEYFKLQGLNTFFVMNRFYPEKHSLKPAPTDIIRIGVFGRNMWHRNITNQVIGALLLKRSVVHVNEISDHFFLDKKRIHIHGIMSKAQFLEIYKDIDINMYISMTDCFPMSVIESMQYGIPCLVSDTSDVYAWNNKLKDWLTVSTIDSPIGINKKIVEVIEKYEEIQKEIQNYLPVLKAETEKSIEEFLK